MVRRYRLGIILLIAVFVSLSPLSGCKEASSNEASEEDSEEEAEEEPGLFGRITENSKADPNTNSEQNSDHEDTSNIGTINITADKAVELAYIEALKWNEGAVLWEVKTVLETSIHYDWMNTGKAYHWLVGFANSVDDSMLHVWIKNGKVDSVEDLGNKRRSEVISDLAADRISVSFASAIDVMVQNGAPTGYMPYAIEYSTMKNDDGSSSIYWFVGYEVKRTDNARELQIYKVDGISGVFISSEYRVFYENEEDEEKEVKGSEDRSVLEFPSEDLSDRYYTQDQRYTIVKFLTLINEGKLEEAIDMMEKNAVPDQSTKKLWEESLGSIQDLGIDRIYAENEEDWTEDRKLFEVHLLLPEDESIIQYGWDPGNSTRWIELIKDDKNQWWIHSIATSP